MHERRAAATQCTSAEPRQPRAALHLARAVDNERVRQVLHRRRAEADTKPDRGGACQTDVGHRAIVRDRDADAAAERRRPREMEWGVGEGGAGGGGRRAIPNGRISAGPPRDDEAAIGEGRVADVLQQRLGGGHVAHSREAGGRRGDGRVIGVATVGVEERGDLLDAAGDTRKALSLSWQGRSSHRGKARGQEQLQAVGREREETSTVGRGASPLARGASDLRVILVVHGHSMSGERPLEWSVTLFMSVFGKKLGL